MQILKTKSGHEIEYFTDPAQMSFERYWLFQKYMIVDSGIGSDIQAIGSHFSKLHQFLANKMNEDAIKEAENLHFSFFSILNGINYVCNSVASIIHSIDGKEFSDLSTEGIDRCANELKKAKIEMGEIDTIFEEVKKKLLRL